MWTILVQEVKTQSAQVSDSKCTILFHMEEAAPDREAIYTTDVGRSALLTTVSLETIYDRKNQDHQRK